MIFYSSISSRAVPKLWSTVYCVASHPMLSNVFFFVCFLPPTPVSRKQSLIQLDLPFFCVIWICLSVCVCLFACLTCSFTYMRDDPSARLFVGLSVCLSVGLCIGNFCMVISFSCFLFVFSLFSFFFLIPGDAIKSVKPYFGLGVNTAFEDCIELDRCGGWV